MGERNPYTAQELGAEDRSYHEGTGEVGDDVVAALEQELEEKGESVEAAQPDHLAYGRVPRLTEPDDAFGSDETSESIAIDTHDVEDLSSEEGAMHIVDESTISDDEAELAYDPGLSTETRAALREFE